ncbi:hypothetical protein FKW77_002390 [Venturia effusa]|uniref:Mitochondrial dicarboxylate transporter n=1 Tax=Venturia effusa TaxID=50376 RepID=A0A517LDD0_9PEZI|nr:hypothetical protein FKW77_002390 [Venturia effusa]
MNLHQWQDPPPQQRPQRPTHDHLRDSFDAHTLATEAKFPCVFSAQTRLFRSKTLNGSDVARGLAKHNAKDARTDMSANAKEVMKSKDVQKRTIHYPFWFGGSASCFAACVTHPLDLGMSYQGNQSAKKPHARDTSLTRRKVRLQTQSHAGPQRNMLQMFGHITQEHGFRGLYRGLSASLLRQTTYSTTRFGVYEELKEKFASSSSATSKKPSFLTLVSMASISGFLGGVAGNPADVLNVRMQHDAALPAAERRNYKHAIDGLTRMVREEGAGSLWKGVWPNSMRAVLMTASQLASYDVFKRLLLAHTSLSDDLTTHFSASLAAGFVATTICSPVDVIKTRIMSAHATEQKSIVRLLGEAYKAEGLGWMFRGWVPSFIRLGPHTIATFVFLEQHKKIYRWVRGLDAV